MFYAVLHEEVAYSSNTDIDIIRMLGMVIDKRLKIANRHPKDELNIEWVAAPRYVFLFPKASIL